ncbi:MAG: arylesterase [Sterolibacteriaceae bacterium]|nr:arylesterase [Sterolibacteriaceae bacterium]MBK9084813.1 arylesterase [Sterolibacteriaceae bacterium]
MLRSMLLGACLLLFGTAHAASGVILVFGDSLSAGYGLRLNEAWPALLEQRLRAEKLRYSVVNASIGGETTAGGRSRLAATLAKHKPDVVIIALGANDGLRGLPLSELRANLGAMLAACRKAGARVLLVGMHMPPNYGPDYTQKFHRSFADVATAGGAALVPFMMEGFADKRDLFQSDGIHPTAQAQPLILENIWPALKASLRK